jgi:hypothetical protein
VNRGGVVAEGGVTADFEVPSLAALADRLLAHP